MWTMHRFPCAQKLAFVRREGEQTGGYALESKLTTRLAFYSFQKARTGTRSTCCLSYFSGQVGGTNVSRIWRNVLILNMWKISRGSNKTNNNNSSPGNGSQQWRWRWRWRCLTIQTSTSTTTTTTTRRHTVFPLSRSLAACACPQPLPLLPATASVPALLPAPVSAPASVSVPAPLPSQLRFCLSGQGDGCCRPFIAIVKLLSVCVWLCVRVVVAPSRSHILWECVSMSAWVAFYETSKCQSMSLNDFYITPNTMTRPPPRLDEARCGVSFWVYLKDSKIRQLYCCCCCGCCCCCLCCYGARPSRKSLACICELR